MDLNQQFEQRYQMLNEQQKVAVDTIEGPVLVVAGPGSGKTELLSLRVANILRSTDTLPSSILCLTFTDSAAVNMQKRLEGLIGPEAYKVAIHTFHSFGREIMSQYPEYFYRGASYAPADEITQIRILQEIFENLPHQNSLNSFHPEQGFTYLKDAKARIGELKKGGLTPEEFRKILDSNKSFLKKVAPLIANIFEARVDQAMIAKIDGLIMELQQIEVAELPVEFPAKSLKNKIVMALELALQEAKNGEKVSTKPITKWKDEFTKKDLQKRTVLKDFERLQKSYDLAEVYDQYLKKLHQLGLYDYDDMLLEAVKALQSQADLRFSIQEKYFYILVDEFQDTNGVQTRMLDLLVNADVNEGRPNIMAVGDDDQAIYKFQGANIENILGFHHKFRDPTVVVLTSNYRSTQAILDLARKVILQGEDRLENRLEGQIQKELLAARNDLPAGEIVDKAFETSFEELFWVAQNIKNKIEQEHLAPNQIAVLAPVHRILEETAKVFNYLGIPVAYERKQNLLEEIYIKEIITILQFIDSLNNHDEEQADYLLPTILSYKFWGLNRLQVWKLAEEAKRTRKSWLQTMQKSESKFIKNMALFLIQLAGDAHEKTAEEIIDLITGVEYSILPNDDNENDLDQTAFHLSDQEAFISPFKKCYFGQAQFDNERSSYLMHLQNLQAFMRKIREYNGSKTLMVHDVVEFVRLLAINRIPLNHTMDFSTQENAVKLMTVHKAKGLEFDAVFVLYCQDEAWVSRRGGDKLAFPCNLPLSPEQQNPEDILRLFFVALTRAKHQLYLTRHRYNDQGREQVLLRFLSGETDEDVKKKNLSAPEVDAFKKKYAVENGHIQFYELIQEVRRHEIYSSDEAHLLKKVIQNYKLSVTHLLNFLNVAEAGPHKFLENNLLRFPQMIGASAAFGSAMHEALHGFYKDYKMTKNLPSLEVLQNHFLNAMNRQRLNKKVFQQKLEKGFHDLKIFYDLRKNSINPNDRVEVDFITQNVVVKGAHLNGKIDRMHLDFDRQAIEVIDYKTGKPIVNWDQGDEFAKRKAWKYKIQLQFYKILVENSRDYRGKAVNTGVLEFLEPKNGELSSLELPMQREEISQLEKLIGIVYQKIISLDFPDISGYEMSMYGIDCFVDDLLNGRV